MYRPTEFGKYKSDFDTRKYFHVGARTKHSLSTPAFKVHIMVLVHR